MEWGLAQHCVKAFFRNIDLFEYCVTTSVIQYDTDVVHRRVTRRPQVSLVRKLLQCHLDLSPRKLSQKQRSRQLQRGIVRLYVCV